MTLFRLCRAAVTSQSLVRLPIPAIVPHSRATTRNARRLLLPSHRLSVSAMSSSSANANDAIEPQQFRRSGNRLSKEQSPYLLQHAHNPVDWYPWGEEAFSKARKEDKPIFLSVGYSTCHWCHVMEVESFESDEVASILNESFVSIKVDREERPDVDKVYMTYIQSTGTGGGWPMSVFLTPSLRPITGGTYFPPEDVFGRIGFKTLLKRITSVWKSKRSHIEDASLEVMRQLTESTKVSTRSESLQQQLAEASVDLCTRQLSERFDSQRGGFGLAPKFPRPSEINFLLRRQKRMQTEGVEGSEKVLHMCVSSLAAMARGGVNDHVGGGFHRYSVDEFWHVPHFEKMLYDQGQLAVAYLDAYTVTKETHLALAAMAVLDYLRREMTHPQGGIYSAQDADSLETATSAQKKEGAFYVWDTEEVDRILGSELATVFKCHYFMKPGGNCQLSPRSDPHGEFEGKNVLIERGSVLETSKKVLLEEDIVADQLADARRRLFEARKMRPIPHLDDKVIVAWNGLAISAFSKAHLVLQSLPSDTKFRFPVEKLQVNAYLAAAERSADFIFSHLFNETENRLNRSFRESPSEAPGFIDDYSFLIAGLLDLYEASGNVRWLRWALKLQQSQDEQFLDALHGGYYSVPEGDPSILLRVKEDYDGAEPSGNSVSACNLLRFSCILGAGAMEADKFLKLGEKTIAAFEERLSSAPMALPQMCCALEFLLTPAKRQVVIAGPKQCEGVKRLAAAAASVFEPNRVILQVDNEDESDVAFWEAHNPSVLKMAKRSKLGDGAMAYVCQNFTCEEPTSDPVILQKKLLSSASIGNIVQFNITNIL